ncbi:universal stress protein [Nannocystis bainbridge]|uniref:Universal stress protein n=1 Tax=Nannocystis bainbridge TaxID=2995303 RepID=A0ABT5ECC8_9BACT|nr:universal stress protein [Nannocystis bainbridge]MDC0722979.1 universal stress protein [Nannocystis bainbridge]
MYTRILAALDGSSRTDLVLRQAAQLAASHGAALDLCRAVNVPIGMPVEAWSLSGEELGARLVELAHQDLVNLRGSLTASLAGEIHVRLGRPAQVICEVADAIGADLIIIGSHGFDTLDRLLGTTAARVVNHAHCSVLVVRPPRDAGA